MVVLVSVAYPTTGSYPRNLTLTSQTPPNVFYSYSVLLCVLCRKSLVGMAVVDTKTADSRERAYRVLLPGPSEAGQ